MLIDVIHDNPGEPPFVSRFRDPELLRNYGYDAIAFSQALLALPDYQAPMVTTDAQVSGELPGMLDLQIQNAHEAGMGVFLHISALVLPRKVVEKNPELFACYGLQEAELCLCPGRDATLEAYGQAVRCLLERWPEIDGIIVRPGVVQHVSHKHLVANALQETSCPYCRGLSLVERHMRLARRLHKIICEEYGKMYVHRLIQRSSPGAPTLHDDPKLFQQFWEQLPQSPKMAVSLAYHEGDGRYGTKFNPCLRETAASYQAQKEGPKQWIEFACEREFEGKGAFPNFQIPHWQELFTTLGITAENAGRYGYFSISRGIPNGASGTTTEAKNAGLGGPYIHREEWIDANIFGLSELTRNPQELPEIIAHRWATHCFQFNPGTPEAVGIANLITPTAKILQTMLCDQGGHSSDMPWVHHDQLDVEAIWTTATRLQDAHVIANLCRQKREALHELASLRQQFEQKIETLLWKVKVKALTNTLTFYQSFAGTVVELFCGFAEYCQWLREEKQNIELGQRAKQALKLAQNHWLQHTQQHAMLQGVPSVFRENTLWSRTNECLHTLEEAGDTQ